MCKAAETFCNFNPKLDTRRKVAYSSSNIQDRQQFLITALLQTIRHASEHDLQHLITLIRDPTQPDAVAACLRGHAVTLQSKGIIPKLDIDETDVISFALQGLCGHRKSRPKPQEQQTSSSVSTGSSGGDGSCSTASTRPSASDGRAVRPKTEQPNANAFERNQTPLTNLTSAPLGLIDDDDDNNDSHFDTFDDFGSPRMFDGSLMDDPSQLGHHHSQQSNAFQTLHDDNDDLKLEQMSTNSSYTTSSTDADPDSIPYLAAAAAPVTTTAATATRPPPTSSSSSTATANSFSIPPFTDYGYGAPQQQQQHSHHHHQHHLQQFLNSSTPHALDTSNSAAGVVPPPPMAFGDTLAYHQHFMTYAGIPTTASPRSFGLTPMKSRA